MIASNAVVVVGTGVAGLVAAYEAHRSGAKVVIVDKAKRCGGNSAKACSGLSAAKEQGEAVDSFMTDTLESGGGDPALVHKLSSESPDALHFLQQTLGVLLPQCVLLGGHSEKRTWAPDQREKRNVGKLLVDALESTLQAEEKTSSYIIEGKPEVERARVKFEEDKGLPNGGQRSPEPIAWILGHQLLTLRCHPETSAVTGVELLTSAGIKIVVEAGAVVLATGGFAGSPDAIAMYAPEVKRSLPIFASTNRPEANGDGLAVGIEAGGIVVDKNMVQLHPTAFIDPQDPTNPTKVLCPESWRGAGAVLIDPDTGRRFVNELAPRDVVAAAIAARPRRHALLVAPPVVAAQLRGVHEQVPSTAATSPGSSGHSGSSTGSGSGFYVKRGLVDLVQWETLPRAFREDEVPMHDALVVASTQGQVNQQLHLPSAPIVCPQTGKTVFPATLAPQPLAAVAASSSFTPMAESAASAAAPVPAPGATGDSYPTTSTGGYLVARVQPAAHYCMGGLRIDESARVLRASKEPSYSESSAPMAVDSIATSQVETSIGDEENTRSSSDGLVPIPGLFAAGEVTGGVHGRNRLGGNSLLDCVVFGREAGKSAAAWAQGL